MFDSVAAEITELLIRMKCIAFVIKIRPFVFPIGTFGCVIFYYAFGSFRLYFEYVKEKVLNMKYADLKKLFKYATVVRIREKTVDIIMILWVV